MIIFFKNTAEVFAKSHCKFCNEPLKLNDNSISGFFKREGNYLRAINEFNSEPIFAVDIKTNVVKFQNLDYKYRVAVFTIELECTKHQYRQVFTYHFDNNYDLKIGKILLEEESVLLLTPNKTYWVRNLFDGDKDPKTEISTWDNDDGPMPKNQFDLDILDDLRANFRVETEWLKISPSIEKFQEKIENLITFG